MRYLFYLLVSLFIFGCSPNFLSSQERPDQLSFPPLDFSFPEVAEQQLQNGMKLYLKEDNELPLVELTVLVEGGSLYDSPDKTGLSQFFATTLSTGGSENLSPAELEAELEAMAAILTVSSSSYAYEIDLSLQRKDLERGIEILADLLRRPRFDAERMELVRNQMFEGIHRQNDNPGSIAGRILSEAVYQSHPFGAYPTVAGVAGFSREDLLEIHSRYFKPQNLWLAVSGDVHQGELVRLLEQQFGDWQSSESFLREMPLEPPAPQGRIYLVDKDIPQTTILMGHPGINKDNPDLYALQVANYILGGGGFNSRMMREVRSNRGLAYSVYSYFQVGRQLPELFIAKSETKSNSTVEVVSLMQQLINQMRDEPVTVAELDLAKKSLINSFVFAFSDSHSVVSRKVRLDYYDYPENYLEHYQQQIAAVSIADVQRVAQQYLHPDKLQIVLVGDSDRYIDAVSSLGLPVEKVDLSLE
ncbi:zinc protease [Desulfuromusa kysingii]|uniref:Zinc protease n=1 Tax=Desulfuromusa kysingii TaxID=37625 RepID=A0A1H3YS84_9BACT|nr:pitrilysin family protein [Desulfuromusa kysingii]SEA14310.1 zinc protease [Desulfuromusa kysingii]